MKRIIEYILGYFIVIIFPISNIFASDYPSIVENDDVIGKYYGTSPIASLTFKGKATNVNIGSIIDVLGGTGIMFYDEVEDSRINAQIWIRSGTTGIRFRSIVRDSEFGASLLKLVKFFIDGNSLVTSQVLFLLIGCVVAFMVSLFVIKFLMSFIKKHDFKPFGVYRIILGVLLLVLFLCNVL